jgi:hypothetical protein
MECVNFLLGMLAGLVLGIATSAAAQRLTTPKPSPRLASAQLLLADGRRYILPQARQPWHVTPVPPGRRTCPHGIDNPMVDDLLRHWGRGQINGQVYYLVPLDDRRR